MTPRPILDVVRPGHRSGPPRDLIVDTDETRVINEASAAIGRAPEIYQRAHMLCEVITDAPLTRGLVRGGTVTRIVACTEPRIRELLAREARWLGPDGAGGTRRVHPAQWAVRGLLARGRWPEVRPIVAVATAPTLRPDGSILSRPGYDVSTAIYLTPSVEISIADMPSRDDARCAVDRLLDVIRDFPASPDAKSAWLSGVMAIAVRPAIDGPTPLILIDATVRGSGKSLMADVAAIITTGRPAARMIYSRDDAEVRKMITAVALAGDPVVLLDNTVGELGCAALDAALTAHLWRDRVLGVSKLTPEIPLRMVWLATGNGVTVGADLIRRTLLVRLEPQCELPEERTGWRYPRLLEHVRTHRAELLGAVLTIARAYFAAGRPDLGLRPMGSFEAWSDLVRSALVWAGQPDPCTTVTDLRAVDARADAFRALVARWPARDGEAVTTTDLLDRATAGSPWRAALIEWCPPGRECVVPTARTLGYALRSVRGRVVAGATIHQASRSAHGARWLRAQLGVHADAGDAVDAVPLRGPDRVISHQGDVSPPSASSAGPTVPMQLDSVGVTVDFAMSSGGTDDVVR